MKLKDFSSNPFPITSSSESTTRKHTHNGSFLKYLATRLTETWRKDVNEIDRKLREKRGRRVAFNEPRHEKRALNLSKAWQKEGSDTALSSPFFSRVIHRPCFFVEQRPGEKERVYKADLNRRANQSRDKFHFTKPCELPPRPITG
ncbi:uncharacterized [Tachysurus ichikawai]